MVPHHSTPPPDFPHHLQQQQQQDSCGRLGPGAVQQQPHLLQDQRAASPSQQHHLVAANANRLSQGPHDLARMMGYGANSASLAAGGNFANQVGLSSETEICFLCYCTVHRAHAEGGIIEA